MLSVIVPVYRNSVLVEYCLDRLLSRLPRGAEVVVVDDASGSETAQVIRRFGVRVVTHPENRGNTAAYNTGAVAAAGDLLVFCDSDVLVGDTVLESFEEILTTTTDAGAVGALLVYPQNGTIQHAGVAFDRWVLSHVYAGSPARAFPFDAVEERQAVTAALFACRRATFERIGGFDETYRDGLEDIEFCLQCREQGLKNLLLGHVPSMHLESATRGPYKSIRRTYNYSIFFSRWKGRFEVDLPRYLARSAAGIDWKWTAGHRVTVVNFCTTPNWPELADAVADRIALGEFHNLSGFIAEDESIDFYRQLPLALQRDPAPLIFIVDRLWQIRENVHWFDKRPIADVVIDRHANIIVTRDEGNA